MPTKNNVLHTYLNSVNSNSDRKKKNTARRAKKFEMKENDELAIETGLTNEIIYSHFQQTYNNIKASIQKIQPTLRKTIKTLLQISKGHAVHYEIAVNSISESLFLNKIEVKQQLLLLVKLKLIVMFEHQWKGHMVKVHTLVVPHILNDEATSINNVQLAQYSLVSPYTILPLEKQFIFFMFDISQSSLLLNENKTIYKSKMEELKQKFLKINPLLSYLEESTFNETHRKEKVNAFCEDAIVNFILQIAYKCNFLVIQHNQFIVHNDNWNAWLSHPTNMQRHLLKCVVDDTIKEMTSEHHYYQFIQLLYSQENWTRFTETNKENMDLVKFGQATGWLDIITNSDSIYMKHKLLISQHSEPLLLPNLQLYCFEDCNFSAIWELQKFAKLEQCSEIIKFQVDVKSLESGFEKGISSEHIESTLRLQHDSESYAQFQRIVSLIKKNNQMNMHVMREKDISFDGKGKFELASIIKQYIQIENDKHLLYLKMNLKDDETKLAMYPAIWFSSLRNYNQTILAQMVAVAINLGLKLELYIEQELLVCFPTQIEVKNNETKIYGFQNVDSNEKLDKILQSWLLSSVNKLRLRR